MREVRLSMSMVEDCFLEMEEGNTLRDVCEGTNLEMDILVWQG